MGLGRHPAADTSGFRQAQAKSLSLRERPRPQSCISPLFWTDCSFSPTPSAMWALDLGGNPMPGNHRTEAINCSWLRKPNYFYVFQWECFQLQWKPIQSRYLAQQLCLSLSKIVFYYYYFLSLVTNNTELSQWGAKGRCCSTQSDMNGVKLALPVSQEAFPDCEEQPGPGRPIGCYYKTACSFLAVQLRINHTENYIV